MVQLFVAACKSPLRHNTLVYRQVPSLLQCLVIEIIVMTLFRMTELDMYIRDM